MQVGCVVAVAIFLGGLSAQAGVFTEQPKKLIEERAYCGVFGTAVGIGNGGQFTGKLIMTTVDTSISGSADLIPKIKSYYGGGGLAGYRKNEYAIEISYWRSEHVAQWMAPLVTYEDRATYHAVNIDLKKYFFPRIPVQPYCMMGFSLPWLVVKNSSTPFPGLIPVQVGDTSWTGLGYNLGAGLEFYATKRVSKMDGVQSRERSIPDRRKRDERHQPGFQSQG